MNRTLTTARSYLVRPVLVLLVSIAFAACGKHVFHRPNRAVQVTEADSMYRPALFDSLAWRAGDRLFTGNEVYARKCDKCHGMLGYGDTEYARSHDLKVPSLLGTRSPIHWDVDTLRRRIFDGHENGMPTFGVAGLTPREIDAVAAYLVDDLRKDAKAESR